MIRTILVPLDGSTRAERALPEACRLAYEEQAVIVLVRAAHATVPRDDPFAQEAAATAAQRYLRAVQQQLTAGGIAARIEVFVSEPAEAIALAALVHGADVIVMSTHGWAGLRHVVLGSVAEQVLRDTDGPVLLVSAGDEPAAMPAGPFRKILVPLDGTAPAEEALGYVAHQAVARDAQVLLVHSVPPAALPIGAGMWSYPYTAPQDLERAEAATRRRGEEMRAYLAERAGVYLPGRAARIEVTLGDPGAAILQVAQDQDADLIVMATHARHGLDYVLHGSVARQVLHHARVPLLLLRRADAAARTEEDHVAVVAADAATPL